MVDKNNPISLQWLKGSRRSSLYKLLVWKNEREHSIAYVAGIKIYFWPERVWFGWLRFESTKVNPRRRKEKEREGRPFQNKWLMPCSWISSSMEREWDVHAATVAWARGSRTDLHLLWLFFLPWPTYHHNWWPYPERIKSTAFPKAGAAGVTLSKEIKNSRTTLLNLSSS